MTSNIEKLLLISGPVGVGKTTVANELSTLLEVDGIAHTFVDLDALTYTFPRSASDAFGAYSLWRISPPYGRTAVGAVQRISSFQESLRAGIML